MGSLVVPSLSANNATSKNTAKALESLPRGILLPVPDNIIEGKDEPENRDSSSSMYLMIFLPIAALLLLISFIALARWRYKIAHEPPGNGKPRTESDYDIPKSEEVERIKNDQELRKSESAKCDLFEEEKPNKMPDSVTIECEVLKESTVENLQREKLSKIPLNTAKITEESMEKAAVPKRPTVLQVRPVVDDNRTTVDDGFLKHQEQQENLASEVVWSKDTCGSEHIGNSRKEGQDSALPLMGKGRVKMKPKGLLKRRGSNVALTISLKNEERVNDSSPPSSMSPKPLQYLRTATALLDPVQLHIKSEDSSRLQQEFWEVPMNHPSEKHFNIPGYGTKNRYRSILPNPHSRVLLPVTPGCEPLSAYINANYVRGYPALSESERTKQDECGKENENRPCGRRKAGFIATQGPMANTIVDFWKMIWQEESASIVMITKLKERKEKCTEYMPTAAGEIREYDQFRIEVSDIRNGDHYTVRKLQIQNSEAKGEIRILSHYWYSEWRDHDTPDKLRGLLTLVQEVTLECSSVVESDHGPVIVHCSAGIGRTGCFIAISNGCQQLKAEEKVDPLRIICQLRIDRGGMIQTWEQYQYVHVALSRYARLLEGDNCNTPLTGSSAWTPDSRGSSRHTTPVSGGGEFKSPQLSSRVLFSPPKSHANPDLTTVTEKGGPDHNGDNHNVPRKSKFLFLCDGDSKRLGNFYSDVTASDDVTMVRDVTLTNDFARSASITKRTKNSVMPHRLSLKLNPKLSPIRDENWLMSGCCEVDGLILATPEPRAQSNGLTSIKDEAGFTKLHSKSKGSSVAKAPVGVSVVSREFCRRKSDPLACNQSHVYGNELSPGSDKSQSQNGLRHVNGAPGCLIGVLRDPYVLNNGSHILPENGEGDVTFDLGSKDLDKVRNILSFDATNDQIATAKEQKGLSMFSFSSVDK